MKSILEDLDDPNVYAWIAVLMMAAIAGIVLLTFLSDAAVATAKKRLSRWWE